MTPELLQQEVNRLRYELENLKTENSLIQTNAEAVELECAKQVRTLQRELQAAETQLGLLVGKYEEKHRQLTAVEAELTATQTRLSEEALDLRYEVQTLREENDRVTVDLEHTILRLNREVGDLKATLTSVLEVNELLEAAVGAKSTTATHSREQGSISERNQPSTTEASSTNAAHPSETGSRGQGLGLGAAQALFLEQELAQLLETIRTLEETSLTQSKTISHLETTVQSLRLVEEANRSLEAKLSERALLAEKLEEMHLEKLELERKVAAYGVSPDDGIITEYTKVRNDNLVLLDQNTQLRSELKIHDEEVDELLNRFEEVEAVVKVLTEKNAKLERQRNLSLREIDALRQQLRDIEEFDHQEMTMLHPSKNGEGDAKGVNSRALDTANPSTGVDGAGGVDPAAGDPIEAERDTKRARVAEDSIHTVLSGRSHRLESRNAALEHERSTVVLQNKSLKEEVERLKAQLHFTAEIKAQQQRVLELRQNPASDNERVKRSLLTALTLENNQLLGKVKTEEGVPRGVYERKVAEKKALERDLFELNKRQIRLKEAFGKKSLEFVNTIAELLGYKLEFISSTKVKVVSKYSPHQYLTVDPYTQTLKLGSGDGDLDAEAAFEDRCKDLITYWVGEQGEIPCFLAALTLELFQLSRTQGRGGCP